MNKKIIVIGVAVLIIVLVTVALYSALTFPTTSVNLQVSFSIGADREVEEFAVTFFQDKVQVEVSVTTGAAMWSASITDANGKEVWSHNKAQGDSTTYESEWIAIQSGSYNFTFGTIGFGNLEASAKVTSKGGFW